MLKKWMLVVAIPIVLQFVFLGLLLKSQRDNAIALAWVVHTKEVIAETEALSRRLVAVRSNMLGLALGGDPRSNPFRSIREDVPVRLARLTRLTQDNTPQIALLGEIEAAVTRYLQWMTETYDLLVGGNRKSALERIETQEGKARLDAVLERVAAFQAREDILEAQRREILDRRTRWSLGLILAGSVASVFSAMVMVFAFSRGFARRIEELADNARKLAEGRTLTSPKPASDEIGQLDAVFHAMARTLKEREQENEMFIYSVSHDLRSPLVNLQGFSRELTYTSQDLRKAVGPLEKSPEVAQRLETLLDRDMPDSIQFIQSAVSRLSGIIDSLLRLSRAGRVEYRVQALDLNAIVARVVEALRGSIAETGAEVIAADLPPAQGDPTVIEQVFANLLSNAVKYLDPARRGRIEVGSRPAGDDAPDSWTYYVKDNGLGIPPGHQAKLFHAFQRLHPGVSQGEGIGLALVKRMVERHGGKIWAESEAGVGSTFFVTLPVDATSPPRTAPTHPTAPATGESS